MQKNEIPVVAESIVNTARHRLADTFWFKVSSVPPDTVVATLMPHMKDLKMIYMSMKRIKQEHITWVSLLESLIKLLETNDTDKICNLVKKLIETL